MVLFMIFYIQVCKMLSKIIYLNGRNAEVFLR